MDGSLISAWETAEVFAWLAHDDSAVGAARCGSDRNRPGSPARFRGNRIQAVQNATDKYLRKGDK